MTDTNKRRVKCYGMTNFVIIDSIWFPLTTYHYMDKGELNTIGIVKVLDTLTKEIKYYIGAAKGKKIDEDEQFVVMCGAPFNSGSSFADLYTLMKLKEV